MQIKLKTPYIPISWGELVDKITILEIKELKINAQIANENVKKELKYLLAVAYDKNIPEEIESLKIELKNVNLKLWEIEDGIREKELAGEFDEVFIQLARSVYQLNDVRAKIKQSINLLLRSELIEEKSYKNFEIKGQIEGGGQVGH